MLVFRQWHLGDAMVNNFATFAGFQRLAFVPDVACDKINIRTAILGVGEGKETISTIASPLAFRNSITAR